MRIEAVLHSDYNRNKDMPERQNYSLLRAFTIIHRNRTMSGMDQQNEQPSDQSRPNDLGRGEGDAAQRPPLSSNSNNTHPENVSKPSESTVSPQNTPTEADQKSVAPGEQTVITQQSQLGSSESLPLPAQLDPTRLGPGDKLGHYELIEYVGGGGMGRVFRALDTKLDRFVAVKVLPCDQVSDPDTLQRFRNEAKSAARLDHENIARAYDIGEDSGLSYLVFEFVEGSTIRDLVERGGPMSLANALNYTLQAADALSHAAGRGIVHRDVKPSNILVTNEGRAKLIDMGLARIQTAHDSKNDLTATGVTLGTFDYISPEQARDPRIVDVRSDIYSLGCTFFFMLTGRPPFPEGTVLQKLLQHQGDEPPNIQEFRPEMPARLAEIFGKMLAKDPNRRYQTPEELIEHLHLLAAQVGLRPAGAAERAWIVSRQRRLSFFERHLPWMAPIGLLLVIWFFLHLYWTYTAVPPLTFSQPYAKPDNYAASPGAGKTPVDPRGQPAGVVDPPLQTKNGNSAPLQPQAPSGPIPPQSYPPAAAEDAKTPGRSFPAANGLGNPGFFLDDDDLGLGGIPKISFNSNTEPDVKPLSPEAILPGTQSPTPTQPIPSPSGSRPATGAASPPSAAESPSPPHAAPAGVLVVDTVGSLPGTYATLRAACNDAKSGDIIELRYNGRREESPLSLGNVSVTIRAGKFFRPVIVFRPNQSDPSIYPRVMFSMTGTRLALVDLAVEMDLPRAIPADEWSLFELGRAETVLLQKCSLTIRNAWERPQAYHEQVAFFKINSPVIDTAFTDKASQYGGVKPSARIELADCIARGEAVFLRAEKLLPVKISWNNGLLVTSQQMIDVRGGQQSPSPGDKIDVELRHLTAVVGGGLCRSLSGGFTSYQLPIALSCTDSIILAASDHPLVEQIDGRDADEMQKLFTYTGDRNCYQGFNVFWSIDDNDLAASPQLIEWTDWQTHWSPNSEKNSLWCRIDWQRLPEPSRLPHTLTPWDYALSESDENPTRGAAGDGSDVGFNAQSLPPLPPETHGYPGSYSGS